MRAILSDLHGNLEALQAVLEDIARHPVEAIYCLGDLGGGLRREYLVVYRDDPPERVEAVRFFQEHAASLFPSMAIPSEVEEMPIEEANAYLRRHPIEEQWSLLTKDNIERLDLIDCGLEVLPDAIGNLTRLRTLYASWGHLTELPATIGRLTALEALWLNDNQLTELPPQAANIPNILGMPGRKVYS